uniref:Peptidase M41 domain-containing protein n=1 Tax=Vitis vinifera TaxID=29760 RepID=F6I425_VITVI
MVVAHGGRCAERVVFGDEITDGGRDDLEKITKIAREMVISPANSRLGLTALTKRVGLMDRPDSPDGELIKYMYIEETEEIAMSGLKVNRHILDMITNELLENSRITRLEGPLPHNDRVRYQPLDLYPAPLHIC